MYVCLHCEFSAESEDEFVAHARTEHPGEVFAGRRDVDGVATPVLVADAG